MCVRERQRGRQTERAREREGEGGCVCVCARGVLLTPFLAPLLKTMARTGSVYVCVGKTARERERVDVYARKREDQTLFLTHIPIRPLFDAVFAPLLITLARTGSAYVWVCVGAREIQRG